MSAHSLETAAAPRGGADRTSPRFATLRDVSLFVALLATSIALGAALAHLLELPNKMDLPRGQYFVVQQIYRGWAMLGVVLVVQLASVAALVATTRDEPATRRLAAVGLVALAAAQAVFWTFTQPANAATENWTMKPEAWTMLRDRWEYSHAAGALCQLVAMAALSWAAAFRRTPERMRP